MRQRQTIFHRFWASLDELLPTLARDRQAAVIRKMRRNAVSGIDFYVLVLLSSGIAFLGLRQNSAAVVIGAMQVAPLAFLIPSKIPTAEILARTQPNLLDLLVALISGAAGAYALCRKEVAASLPGVAIAVALVPPL